MKNIRIELVLMIGIIGSYTTIIKPSETDFDEDFVMVEGTENPLPEQYPQSQQKAKITIDDAKKLITRTEEKLNAVKGLVDSKEVSGIVQTLKNIKSSLKKMIFKYGPRFQLTNKSSSSIWLALVVGDEILTNQDFGRDEIAPGDRLTFEIDDLEKDMKIGIFTEDPHIVTLTEDGNIDPTPDYLYVTTAGARGKTKYVTWNPEKDNRPSKYLYPQTGRLAGIVGVSSSNYSLSNNIKSMHIAKKEQRRAQPAID